MTTNTKALPAGTTLTGGLKKYRVVKQLGAGGFGITYLVECREKAGNTDISSFYAMKEHFLSRCCERAAGTSKVLYSNPVADEVQNSQRDFIAEAMRLQKLGNLHNNIVRVHDIFQTNNTAYYTMEFLQGKSLRDYVAQRGRLSEKEMLEIMTPVADAVGFLHANRMTHLDIKPDNIMLTPDKDGKLRPVLIDFGLSKHYDSNGTPTSTINTLGCSDGYSPVEQYGGITTFSPTADIYALGATMAFCVTGQNPRKATDMLPGDAAAYTAGLSPAIASLITSMLDMNRAARPQDIRTVLSVMQGGASPSAYPQTFPSIPSGPERGVSDNGVPGVPPPPPVYPDGSRSGYDYGYPEPPKKNRTLPIVLASVAGVVLLACMAFLIVRIFKKNGGDNGNENVTHITYADTATDTFYSGEVVSTYVEADNLVSYGPDTAGRAASIGESGPLKVTLTWDFSGDLDLIVNQANMTDIYYGHLYDDVYQARHTGDQTGGYGSYESISWRAPGTGLYDVFVRVRNVPDEGGVLKVVVKSGSDTTVYTTRVIRNSSDGFCDVHIVEFTY